jgi:hypothetical protein
MVLLFNVYITNTPANQTLNLVRGCLTQHSKLDVAKYSLSSLAVAYPWKRAIVNIELAPECADQIDEENLQSYIEDLFQDTDLVYSNKRNLHQQDWISTYDLINDDLILYLGNHDHIFLDNSNDYFLELVESVRQKLDTNPSIAISHWPENIRWAKSGYIELNEQRPRQLNQGYTIGDLSLQYNTTCIDSLLVITKNIYYEWFLQDVWDTGVVIPRTEGIGQHSILTIKNSKNKLLSTQTMHVPYRELFRHFDGYMHQLIDNNTCPSLAIPAGFFDSNIRIRYGYDDYKQDWVNINPENPNYYAYSTNGTDYKLTLDDLPLFWKNKVAQIDNSGYINGESAIQYRLQSAIQAIYSDSRYNPYIDGEVQQRILEAYMKNYKQYKLV